MSWQIMVTRLIPLHHTAILLLLLLPAGALKAEGSASKRSISFVEIKSLPFLSGNKNRRLVPATIQRYQSLGLPVEMQSHSVLKSDLRPIVELQKGPTARTFLMAKYLDRSEVTRRYVFAASNKAFPGFEYMGEIKQPAAGYEDQPYILRFEELEFLVMSDEVPALREYKLYSLNGPALVLSYRFDDNCEMTGDDRGTKIRVNAGIPRLEDSFEGLTIGMQVIVTLEHRSDAGTHRSAFEGIHRLLWDSHSQTFEEFDGSTGLGSDFMKQMCKAGERVVHKWVKRGVLRRL